MKSTLIDELVNFKEGFSTGLIEIRRASNGGAGGPGCGAARCGKPVVECRERLMLKRRGSGGETAE
ncbi:TPA: hypothetical protein ACK3O9_000167, partial [Burkholderia cepacia]